MKIPARIAVALVSLALVSSFAFAQQTQNPIKAFKDAYKKSKQQPPPGQPQNPQSQPTGQGQTSAPVTADDLDKPQPEANIVLDPKALPDLMGIHLGMPLRTAALALQAAYPKLKITPNAIQMPTIDKRVIYNLYVATNPVGGNEVKVGVLLPPNQQVVWSMSHLTNVSQGTPINRTTLLASLRQKYGKETYALHNNVGPTSSDADIIDMFWMYDEHGSRIPRPNPGFGVAEPGCPWGEGGNAPGQSGNPTGFNPGSAWCASTYVGVHAQFTPDSRDPANLIMLFRMDAIDVPLAVRAQKATADWYQNIGQRQHQEEIEKSKGVQPKL